MRGALVDLQRRALDQLRRQHRRGTDRHDLIVVAMQDQGRLVDLLEVFSLVRFREGLNAKIAGGHAGHHALQPEGLAHALRNLRFRPVVAVEGHGQVLEELRAVAQHTLADAVEDIDRQTAGIGCRLQHQRRNCADQNCLRDPVRAVAPDVAGNFAAASGVADMDRVFQIEFLHELREVIGIGVHVVAAPGLARTAVAAAVMRDDTISV
jgi:hypothetical protein